MKNKIIFISLLLISILLVAGCGSKPYEQPTSVETNPVATPQQEAPRVMNFNVGESASNNKLKVTVNSVRYDTMIDESGNEYMIASAPSGKQFVIVDLTVENLQKDVTETISTLISAKVVDNEGYTYDENFEGLIALEKAFKDGDLLPGMTKRGELVFLVPTSATSLKLTYLFGIGETTAIFKLK